MPFFDPLPEHPPDALDEETARRRRKVLRGMLMVGVLALGWYLYERSAASAGVVYVATGAGAALVAYTDEHGRTESQRVLLPWRSRPVAISEGTEVRIVVEPEAPAACGCEIAFNARTVDYQPFSDRVVECHGFVGR